MSRGIEMTIETIETRGAIHPFSVDIPKEALADLHQRPVQTRLPNKDTITDYSQDVPFGTVEQLLRYWQTDYNWRKVEARINAVPNINVSASETGSIHSSAPLRRRECV